VSVVLVDYGAGNLRSLRAAFERVGASVRVSADPGELAGAALVVIPGVGAARHAMRELHARGLVDAIDAALAAGARLFGVCVGLQLLFEHSVEGDTTCLGLLPGRVTRLEGARRLPHMGWNDVEPEADHPLCAGLPAPCYFAHSYAASEIDDEVVLARTRVEQGSFASLVGRGAVAGMQFHPERSSAAGRQALRAVLRWADAA
jgi:imidazole glycerol-phosphate synthase subunit HisH